MGVVLDENGYFQLTQFLEGGDYMLPMKLTPFAYCMIKLHATCTNESILHHKPIADALNCHDPLCSSTNSKTLFLYFCV